MGVKPGFWCKERLAMGVKAVQIIQNVPPHMHGIQKGGGLIFAVAVEAAMLFNRLREQSQNTARKPSPLYGHPQITRIARNRKYVG